MSVSRRLYIIKLIVILVVATLISLLANAVLSSKDGVRSFNIP